MPAILLVDDDELFSKMVHTILTRAKHQVFRARNGTEALQLFDTRAVDLVLTDLIMPGMEGMELIRKLRQINPDVKIIAMSGGGRNSPESYLPIAKQMGAACTLAKPFSGEELATAIESVLGKS